MIRTISLGLSLLILVMFLLPWFAITCAGQEIITVTGIDMVTGFEYEIPEMAERASPEVLAIVVFSIGIIAVGAYFIRGKDGRIIRGVLATLGFIFLLVLKFKIDDIIGKAGQGLFQTSYLFAFWVTLISFITVAILNFLNFAGLRR